MFKKFFFKHLCCISELYLVQIEINNKRKIMSEMDNDCDHQIDLEHTVYCFDPSLD